MLQGKLIKEMIMGIGITVLLFVVSIFIPVFFYAIPVPVLLYRLKLGRNHGLIVQAVVLFMITVLSGGVNPFMIYITIHILLGYLMAEAIEHNFTTESTIIYPCVCAFLTGMIGFIIYCSMKGATALGTISSIALDFLKKIQEAGGQLNMTEAQFQTISEKIAELFPASAMVSLLLCSVITLSITKIYLNKKDLVSTDFGSFKNWKTPEYMIWGTIITAIMMFTPVSILNNIGLNGLVFFSVLYFIQGIIVISYYLNKKQFPRILKFVFYMAIIIHYVTLFITIALGIFDMWFNFRKLGKNNS